MSTKNNQNRPAKLSKVDSLLMSGAVASRIYSSRNCNNYSRYACEHSRNSTVGIRLRSSTSDSLRFLPSVRLSTVGRHVFPAAGTSMYME